MTNDRITKGIYTKTVFLTIVMLVFFISSVAKAESKTEIYIYDKYNYNAMKRILVMPLEVNRDIVSDDIAFELDLAKVWERQNKKITGLYTAKSLGVTGFLSQYSKLNNIRIPVTSMSDSALSEEAINKMHEMDGYITCILQCQIRNMKRSQKHYDMEIRTSTDYDSTFRVGWLGGHYTWLDVAVPANRTETIPAHDTVILESEIIIKMYDVKTCGLVVQSKIRDITEIPKENTEITDTVYLDALLSKSIRELNTAIKKSGTVSIR